MKLECFFSPVLDSLGCGKHSINIDCHKLYMYDKQIRVLVISLFLDGIDKELPTMWIFPYFMEPHLKAALPSLTMLDYKVLNLNFI